MQIWSNTSPGPADPCFCYRLSDACVDCWLQMIPFLITASPWDCYGKHGQRVNGKSYARSERIAPFYLDQSSGPSFSNIWLSANKTLVFFVNFPFSIRLFVYNIIRNVICILVLFPSMLAMQFDIY